MFHSILWQNLSKQASKSSKFKEYGALCRVGCKVCSYLSQCVQITNCDVRWSSSLVRHCLFILASFYQQFLFTVFCLLTNKSNALIIKLHEMFYIYLLFTRFILSSFCTTISIYHFFVDISLFFRTGNS